MAYEIITNRSMDAGIHVVFQYVNSVTNGLFMNAIVLMIYFTLCFGMYFSKKRMTSDGDFPACFAVSSYVMIGFLVLIGMIPGMINGFIIVQVIVLSSIATVWLYFSKKNSAF